MHSRLEDDAQYEWCRQWEEEHRRKITRKKQKKIRRVRHWCNCKLYIKYAWYEFRAMVHGRGDYIVSLNTQDIGKIIKIAMKDNEKCRTCEFESQCFFASACLIDDYSFYMKRIGEQNGK